MAKPPHNILKRKQKVYFKLLRQVYSEFLLELFKPAGPGYCCKSQGSEMPCGQCPQFLNFIIIMMTENKNSDTFSVQSYSDDIDGNPYFSTKFSAPDWFNLTFNVSAWPFKV